MALDSFLGGKYVFILLTYFTSDWLWQEFSEP